MDGRMKDQIKVFDEKLWAKWMLDRFMEFLAQPHFEIESEKSQDRAKT